MAEPAVLAVHQRQRRNAIITIIIRLENYPEMPDRRAIA